MTTTINNEHKELNFSSEREQSQACLNSAEREKNQGRKVLNVPNLRFPEFQGEWEKCTLGNNVKIQGGYAFKSELFLRKGIPIIRISNLPQNASFVDLDDCTYYKEGNYNSFEVHNGDLLIAMSGATTGKTAIYNKKTLAYLNQRVGLFKSTNSDSLYYPFLYAFVSTPVFKRQLSTRLIAGAQPNISSSDIESIRISIPQKTSEQEKIAHLMLLLDKRIATQNKIIDKLQSLIKGINQRVFMNNGINYKLGEVCEIRSGYSGNQLLSKKGLKVSRIETISGHKVNLERVGYVAPFESSENYKLQVGDILFSNINSVEYIGNTAFIDKDYDLYHGMNLLRLTPNNMVVIPFYLYLLLNTNRMLNRFKTVCNKAVSQASINQTELGKTVVQIPDINAQKQICELYQALYDKLESEKYANSLFQKQKQYLLRQMFI